MSRLSNELRRDGPMTAVLLLLVSGPVAAYLIADLSNAGKLSLDKPWALLLLAALPLTYWVSFRLGSSRRACFGFSSTALASRLPRGPIARLAVLPAVLRLVAVGLLALALAGPLTRDRGGRVEVEGIDIMVALDVSDSMKAPDLLPNRLEAAKKVLDEFISRRRGDRIGIVLFGKDAYTQCPLTLDYSVLRNMLAGVRIGLIDGAGTAIGNALALSLARLRHSDAKSKVVILLTDGENNSGNVTPREAARYARAMKVKTFTILMGPQEGTPRMVTDMFGRTRAVSAQYSVNPELLRQIAAQTGGKAFVATDRSALEHNFEQILSELDRSTRHDVAAVYTSAYMPFTAWGLALVLIEALLRLTRFREFP